VEKRLQDMIGALRATGHRVSPQRMAVLRVLAKSGGHPDAATIQRMARRSVPDVGLATVYKTISALKNAGQILELEFSGLPNRYDGMRPGPHPHAICEACGRIVDPAGLDLKRLAAAVGRETGFTIRGSRVDFFGTCAPCRRRGLG
jgi:Fur family peroxide stress response transcriptional regulator